MSRKFICLVALGLGLSIPALADATTGEDLSARIVVDGRAAEYEGDEWVLDASSPLPERLGDSRWGRDNDIVRMAITWDVECLYVAVECVTLGSELLLLIDHTAGGIADMRSLTNLRRNIVLAGAGAGFRPDLVVHARPQRSEPEVFAFGDGQPPRLLEPDAVVGRFVQSGVDGGGLEVAIPWRLVGPAAETVAVVAAVTGGIGSGCGDVAPDAHAELSTIRTDVAVLDRPLIAMVDANRDGTADTGVSPRDVSTVENASEAASAEGVDIGVVLGVRSFAPDEGETVSFTLKRENGGSDAAVFVSARVYSRSGQLVRALFEDERRDLESAQSDEWDGTDGRGRIVPGGIYIVNISWGIARGSRTGSTSVAVAVVR